MPSDVLIREESSKPGPADYDLPRPRIRGGDLPMGPARPRGDHIDCRPGLSSSGTAPRGPRGPAPVAPAAS